MVDKFLAQSNRIQVIRQDKASFDTNAPSIHLFDASKISLTDYAVEFPNLFSTIYYKQTQGDFGFTGCETWSALLPQEWGTGYGDYSPTSTQYLADGLPIRRELSTALLGTVPTGTDYLDVRARLVRTVSAPTFMRYMTAPIILLPENEWINLPGGSCPCEYFYPLSRMFDVVLSGTNVYLNRYQSTLILPSGSQTINTTGGNTDNTVTTQIGTSWGNYANAPVYWALPAVFFDTKDPDGSGNKRAPWGSSSTNSCSTGSVVDYRAVYAVDFEITPGRYL